MRSSDINEYLQDALGRDCTAKDFRTWMATVLAAVGLAAEEEADSDHQRRAAAAQVVRNVAHALGNTPAVARGSYVDPRVIERYEDRHTVGAALTEAGIDTVAEDMLGSTESRRVGRRRDDRGAGRTVVIGAA